MNDQVPIEPENDLDQNSRVEEIPQTPIGPLALPLKTGDDAAQRVTLLQVVLAPWRFMFRPATATKVMLRGSALSILIASIVGCMVLYCVAFSWVIIDMMIVTEWTFSERQIKVKDFVEVLTEISYFYAAEIFAVVAISLIGAWFAISLFQLPMVHTRGKSFNSFDRSARSALAATGSVFVFFLIITGIVAVENVRWGYGYGGSILAPLPDWLMPLLGMFGFFYVLFMSDQAARGAREPIPNEDVILTCEKCSYDLVHLPESGRCPECGAATAIATDASYSRSGVMWEVEPKLRNWLSTCRSCVLNPSRFYERLQMQTDDAAGWRFVRLNYALVALINAIAVAAINIIFENESLSEGASIFFVVFVATAIGAWLWHRTVGLLALASVFFRNQAPDFFRVRKIWLYESAMVWPVWAFQIWLALMMYANRELIEYVSTIYNSRYLVAIFPMFVLGELLLFLGICGLRYSTAVNITRWSNF